MLTVVKPEEQQTKQETPWEAFWTLYPRKVGKLAAIKAWSRVPVDEQPAVLEGLVKWRDYWRKKGTEWEFMPHPATWLGQGRWMDELPTPEAVRPLSAAQANDMTGIGSRDDYKRGEIPANVMAELQRLKRR